MQGIALAIAASLPFSNPIELPPDVYEIRQKAFVFPIAYDPDQIGDISKIFLYVSQDRGTTWIRHTEFDPSDEFVEYTARKDGLYWFAAQVVKQDGSRDPSRVGDFYQQMKVYVNSEAKLIVVQKSREELQREVEQLRAKVSRLEKRILRLKADRSPE